MEEDGEVEPNETQNEWRSIEKGWRKRSL